ncbi:MAG: hypothetical protein JXA95_18930 [Spirochaetales bacterium]|nr:hypothetical protein [Spirochaetales bacterium]
MMKSPTLYLIGVIFLLFSCEKKTVADIPFPGETKPRVLYINSYNPEFPWSRGVMMGILSVFQTTLSESGELDSSNSPVELRVYHMRTLLDQSQQNIDFAVGEAREIIKEWKPDLVIASDDNASKYLIAPYYKESSLPFLFCGVNWDADDYGFPTQNITGMLEVTRVEELIETLLPIAAGDRIFFLRASTNTSRKESRYLSENLKHQFSARLVSTYNDWKEEFIRIQSEADILLTTYPSNLKDWDGDTNSLHQFMEENTRIPTGGWDVWMADNVLITIANSAEEQGEWAASRALEILRGKSPSDIPVTENSRGIYYLNMRLANRLNVFFPTDLIERSQMTNTGQDTYGIFFVNSYNKGYSWSDDIERAFKKSLERSPLKYELRFFRMDTKQNQEKSHIEERARIAYGMIEEWQPDIVIGSDDNFVKYLVLPYLLGSEIPVVFCGVNWDASGYGLPAQNVTGMVEVDPVEETLALLRRFTRGERVGLLFREEDFNHTIHRGIEEKLGKPVDAVAFAATFEQWKEAYLKMQDVADMMILYTPVNIEGWNDREALSFIYAHTKIPVATTMEQQIPFALLGNMKINEEQGWWLGKTVISILEGTPVDTIPLGTNRESKLVINMAMAKQLEYIIPSDILDRAELWNGEAAP